MDELLIADCQLLIAGEKLQVMYFILRAEKSMVLEIG
jgi:hypothetical protein